MKNFYCGLKFEKVLPRLMRVSEDRRCANAGAVVVAGGGSGSIGLGERR